MEAENPTTGREALAVVADKAGSWNWVLFGLDADTLPLEGGGPGSIDAMREFLEGVDYPSSYGLLRLTFGTGTMARSKWVFVHVSDADNRTQKPGIQRSKSRQGGLGQRLEQRPKLLELCKGFANITAELEFTSLQDLNPETVIERLLAYSTVDDGFISVEHFREAERRAQEERERKARERAAAREEAERKALKAAEEAERQAREAALEEERRAREEAERIQREKEEAERRAIEAAAEAERRAREEAERRQREKEEAERRAREEAERLQREKEEAERRAREEAERLRREKEEADRKAREEAERLRKIQEEEERRAREEAERLQKIKEEEERKAREAALEAERKAKEEADRLEKERMEIRKAAEEALRAAVKSGDPNVIADLLDDAREKGADPAVIEEVERVRDQVVSLEDQVREALKARAFAGLPSLIKQAKDLQITHRPLWKEAARTASKCHFYDFTLKFAGEGHVGPRRSSVWLSNPTVQVMLSPESTEPGDVSFRLERISGDTLFGFHCVQNSVAIPASCPCVVPGGPLRAEVQCCREGFAVGQATLERGKLFCIPSPLELSQDGGRVHLLVASSRKLNCSLLPERRWAFETEVQCSWSMEERSAAGAWGKQSWFRNPQFRVFLETEDMFEKVCIMATLSVQTLERPQNVSLHVVKNRQSYSFNPHAAIVEKSHEIMAAPDPMYQEPSVGICFEISKGELILDSTRVPPFYMVASTQDDFVEGNFAIQLFASRPLTCQRVSLNNNTRAAGARSVSPAMVARGQGTAGNFAPPERKRLGASAAEAPARQVREREGSAPGHGKSKTVPVPSAASRLAPGSAGGRSAASPAGIRQLPPASPRARAAAAQVSSPRSGRAA